MSRFICTEKLQLAYQMKNDKIPHKNTFKRRYLKIRKSFMVNGKVQKNYRAHPLYISPAVVHVLVVLLNDFFRLHGAQTIAVGVNLVINGYFLFHSTTPITVLL